MVTCILSDSFGCYRFRETSKVNSNYAHMFNDIATSRSAIVLQGSSEFFLIYALINHIMYAACSQYSPILFLIFFSFSYFKCCISPTCIMLSVILYFVYRCGEPAAVGVFSNFSLLLTEDPVEESDDEIDMGVIYGEDKHKSSTSSKTEEEEDDDKEIDPDDRLYFPSEEKEIDISKPIRDLVHLEITINAICDANCKGLCLRCGTNLNKRWCNCGSEEVQDGKHGPLKNLRKQMQQR